MYPFGIARQPQDNQSEDSQSKDDPIEDDESDESDDNQSEDNQNGENYTVLHDKLAGFEGVWQLIHIKCSQLIESLEFPLNSTVRNVSSASICPLAVLVLIRKWHWLLLPFADNRP